ncbi:MAG TPA: hypothetical protein VFZ09_46215 [Archangium sp.]|uniref:hypothetical protein n=1 Tax=Archangium sp. TaxID=1872627 RepID=UPI002E306713|nr:hypothetical protein [Archangium sp.]HEX5753673.1 hypothetical protein [Archangium sp.]
MTNQERLKLLEKMSRLKHVEDENVSTADVFLPLPMHRMALRPEMVIIRGGRGTGKSALFRFLRTSGPLLRDFFQDTSLPDASFIDAFSDDSQAHPQPIVLDSIAATRSMGSLRVFWMTHLLVRIQAGLPGSPPLPPQLVTVREGREHDLAQWLPWAEANIGQVASALDGLESYLSKQKRTVFATYDHLDRLGEFDREVRSRYASSLLALWLSLSNRFRHLRAKIFLRDDLFEDAEGSFADASKLRPRSIALDWTVEALYRVVVRQLAAPSDEHPSRLKEMRTWLRSIAGLQLTERQGFGLLPGEMPETVQRAFADRLTGRLMGKGLKKGFTYRWIPNRLQDANVRIVPRSFLVLLGHAAEDAKNRSPGNINRLMSPQSLVAALVPTSRARVKEISEEYPIVNRLENLRGLEVMLERDEVIRRLAKPVPAEHAGLPQNGESVLDELLRIGVLKERDDGRIDVPDIYRYGFDIKRKGGVARPK